MSRNPRHSWTAKEDRKLYTGLMKGLSLREIQVRFLSHLTIQQLRDRKKSYKDKDSFPKLQRTRTISIEVKLPTEERIARMARINNCSRSLVVRGLLQEAFNFRDQLPPESKDLFR